MIDKFKRYILLHLNIMLFSFTSVFSKAASGVYAERGLSDPLLYLFLFLMLVNCAVYAVAWQKVIRWFDLNVAYANRTVYLIWAQIWAVVIFHEHLSVQNLIGLALVLAGVLVVQRYE